MLLQFKYKELTTDVEVWDESAPETGVLISETITTKAASGSLLVQMTASVMLFQESNADFTVTLKLDGNQVDKFVLNPVLPNTVSPVTQLHIQKLLSVGAGSHTVSVEVSTGAAGNGIGSYPSTEPNAYSGSLFLAELL
jgi:hypothetical protein